MKNTSLSLVFDRINIKYANFNIQQSKTVRIIPSMKRCARCFILLLAFIVFFPSCGVMEKSSLHGFSSGYYTLKSGMENVEKVYVDANEENIDVYPVEGNQLNKNERMVISLLSSDTLFSQAFLFSKQSLDIDITTILFKFFPPVDDLPAQLNTDFNAALYAGWRHDYYHVKGNKDPLGKCRYEIVNRGFDYGVFAGTGTTLISPFTTQNARADEYNGFVLQFGLAGFLESNVASFGLGIGLDYLLSPDRDIWIYNNRPWMGFIIGIALN